MKAWPEFKAVATNHSLPSSFPQPKKNKKRRGVLLERTGELLTQRRECKYTLQRGFRYFR